MTSTSDKRGRGRPPKRTMPERIPATRGRSPGSALRGCQEGTGLPARIYTPPNELAVAPCAHPA